MGNENKIRDQNYSRSIRENNNETHWDGLRKKIKRAERTINKTRENPEIQNRPDSKFCQNAKRQASTPRSKKLETT